MERIKWTGQEVVLQSTAILLKWQWLSDVATKRQTQENNNGVT